LQVVHKALELGATQAAAAADVDRMQVAGPHQRVDGGPSDAQYLGSFFRGQEKWVGGKDFARRLRISHVDQLPVRASLG